MRQCTGCKVRKPYNQQYFPLSGKGEGKLASRCKACKKEARKKYGDSWTKEQRKAYLKARSRAMTRLSKACPELYRLLLEAEMDKEPAFQQKSNTRSRTGSPEPDDTELAKVVTFPGR